MTTTQACKRQCKVITVKEKFAMIRTLEAGYSRREVVDMFNCSQSTISRILSEKEGIVKDAQDNVHSKRENLLYYKELDTVLSIWAREMKNSKAMITAYAAKKKAEELSLAMGLELKPSTGWLYKWKERENITFAKRSKAAPHDVLKDFMDRKDQLFQIRGEREENSKRLKLNEDCQSSSSKEKQKVEQNEQNNVHECNVEDKEPKPRTKREYIKRLPIFDASGAICRSRKEKTFLTLLQKLEILERLKNGERRPDLIVEYNLSSSAMSQIVTDEEKILKLAAGGQNLHMKRIRGGIFKDGEAELNVWVQQKLEMGESLTRTHIKNKAKEIAERLNIRFKASTGWLEKWKARMNLDFNENQKLHRKMPTLIPSDEEVDNNQAIFELSDPIYDDQDSEGLQKRVKQEQMENDYFDDTDTNDGFSGNDIDAPDIKPELLTPQQFYLQTIQSNTQTLHGSDDKQTEVQQENEADSNFIEENDVKLFPQTVEASKPNEKQYSRDDCISPPERTGSYPTENNLCNGFIKPKPFAQQRNFEHSKTDIQNAETLHEQVLLWLNRYHIAPGPATELMNILQPHLSSVARIFPNLEEQNYIF